MDLSLYVEAQISFDKGEGFQTLNEAVKYSKI